MLVLRSREVFADPSSPRGAVSKDSTKRCASASSVKAALD
jgi:hypothetical protein